MAQSALILAIDDAKWQMTEFIGVEAAVLWGDPEHEARGAELLRIGAGIAFPKHTHAYDERTMVISGTFVLIDNRGDERPLRPGSYYYLPARIEHASRCGSDATCILYSEVIPAPPHPAP